MSTPFNNPAVVTAAQQLGVDIRYLGKTEVPLLQQLVVTLLALNETESGGGGNPNPVTVTSTVATGNGTVAAGAASASFTFSSDFSGTLNGAAIDPAVTGSKAFNAPTGRTLPAISYTVAAGSVTVDVMT